MWCNEVGGWQIATWHGMKMHTYCSGFVPRYAWDGGVLLEKCSLEPEFQYEQQRQVRGVRLGKSEIRDM
jgi:hypothetical protein